MEQEKTLTREAFRLAEKMYKEYKKKKKKDDAWLFAIIQQRMIEQGYGIMWECLERGDYKEYEQRMLLVPETVEEE